jgi:hypothetical protein
MAAAASASQLAALNMVEEHGASRDAAVAEAAAEAAAAAARSQSLEQQLQETQQRAAADRDAAVAEAAAAAAAVAEAQAHAAAATEELQGLRARCDDLSSKQALWSDDAVRWKVRPLSLYTVSQCVWTRAVVLGGSAPATCSKDSPSRPSVMWCALLAWTGGG